MNDIPIGFGSMFFEDAQRFILGKMNPHFRQQLHAGIVNGLNIS
jgi:hypothetical protein